jgi:hypothetical protein
MDAARNPMLALPLPNAHRFAVYSGSYELDLTTQPEQPQALFADKAIATAYAHAKWPGTFKIVDLSESYP